MASIMLEIAGGDEEYASIQFTAFAKPRLAHRTFNVSPGPSTLSTVLFIAFSFALRTHLLIPLIWFTESPKTLLLILSMSSF